MQLFSSILSFVYVINAYFVYELIILSTKSVIDITDWQHVIQNVPVLFD